MRPLLLILLSILTSVALGQDDCLSQFKEIESKAKSLKSVYYKEATQKLDSLGKACSASLPMEKKDTLALIYHKKGVYHYLLKEYIASIKSYEQSLKIRLNDPQVDPVLIGHSHLNIAKAHKQMRNFAMAKEHLLTAYDTLVLHNNYKRTGESCHELALVLWELQDFYPALDYADQAASYYKLAGQTRSIKKNQAAILLLKGVLQAELVHIEAAKQSYSQARMLYQELGLDFQVSKCWNNIAELYYQQKHFDSAILAYKHGLALLEKIDYLKSPEASQMYNGLGVCAKNLKMMFQAKVDYQKAYSIAKEVYANENHPDIARIQENLGDFHLAERNSWEALTYYERAIQAMLPYYLPKSHNGLPDEVVFDLPKINDSTFVNGDYGMLLRLIHSKANILSELSFNKRHIFLGKDREELKEIALRHYLLADRLLFRMRKEQLHVNSHLYWVEKGKPLYESAITHCFKMNKLNEALYFAEKSKASILLQGLKTREIAKKSPEFQRVLEQENQLKTEVFSLENQLRDAFNKQIASDSLQKIQGRLVRKRIELHQFVFDLYENHYKYFKATFSYDDEYLREDILHGDAVVFLPGDKAKTAIQFFEGKKKSYAFFLQEGDSQKYKSWMLEVKWNRETLKKFIDLINDPSKASKKEDLGNYKKWAYELYSDLLGSMEGREVRNKLVFIPDGSLQRLPFEALLTARNAANSYKALPYLIQKFNCSYAYSLAVLEQSRAFPEDEQWGVLGVAPVKFPKQESFTFLPKSREEVKNIVGKWSGKSLIEQKASLERFARSISRYKVIHLATHAFARREEDGLPFIAFADTQLYLPQIYGLRTDAEMIVLSACQTLEGKDYQGEGIMSLTRAFRFIGVPSIVASLWQADENSSYQIMIDFYNGLGEGIEKDEALRNAKLSYIESSEQAFPFYWAHMLHRGSTEPIKINPERNYSLLFFLGIILLFAVGMIIFRRRS
ncbi:MAG: CHAT domain-containing protein [Bacteroidia bacterium]|nr:CHAT domain-containing protein [Bacteroidia bacterium]